MIQLIIRKGEPADAEGLERIEQACFSVPWSLDSLRRDLEENPKALYIVAEKDGCLLGYVSVWNIREEGHINNVAVLPEYQGKHVASLLMSALIRVTEDSGVKSHTLEVRAGNVAAQHLYEKFGFRSVGTRPNYYEDDGEDAVIMWRIGDPEQREEES